jgi:diguanylate cyclase (GGDEF)-like protein
LAFHIAHEITGFGDAAFDELFALWFQPLVYLAAGAATLGRASSIRTDRLPWALVGAGLILYAAGSIYFNVGFGDDPSPPFPSIADGLWLAMYPLAFAGIVLLARREFPHLGATAWLDGAIAGAVVAALGAAVIFQPVFDLTVEHGAAAVARLAYPTGDLLSVGLLVVVWGVSARRFDRFWAAIGLAFALLALGDGVYVVEAARGDWAPGGWLDLPFAVATMLLAASAWLRPAAPPANADERPRGGRVPVVFALAAVVLTAYSLVGSPNPLTTALVLLALLAVVVRFGLTLARLTRQRMELAALASTDPLTGLANHRTLHERLAEELARARRHGSALSVIALDLDHFKLINDTYGHTEGDSTLQAIARELQRQARSYDMVARVGGEEFALVLPHTGSDAAYDTAERCRAALARLSVHGAGISCSAGVASYPCDDPDGARLLEFADGALYWAKRAGRAQTRRYDPREVVLLSSAEQQAQVRAVLEDPEALTPVFQPIVEVATGRIGGYEALTRFLHSEPVRPPDHWFAQARRCGLGSALEARALEVALAVPGRPPGTFVSLNLSPAALVSREVAAVLPADLSDVVIELTEDDLFSTDTALDVQLAALRARGARIAVDDAGAGYAGLQQLIRVKPDILKLDRSLVQGIHADDAKIALLEALSRFAVTTGAAVCGEGIEEVDELRTLASLDVTYAQGFALGRPGPAWPTIDGEIAGEVASADHWGMRVARLTTAGPPTIGEVTEALARVRSPEELNGAVRMIESLTHSDDVAISRVLSGERCVETLSDHEWSRTGERYSFDDYRTTERVILDQVIGQVVQGDPAADAAELEMLRQSGFGAVLLTPVVYRAETIGLLEFYRSTARPWTPTEIDQARMLAHHVGSVIRAPRSGPDEWLVSPDASWLRELAP